MCGVRISIIRKRNINMKATIDFIKRFWFVMLMVILTIMLGFAIAA
jgi:hypothetical protein